MTDLYSALSNTCRTLGVMPPGSLPDSGKWLEADIEGDPHGKGDARIKLFLDGEGGIVHNWKSGEQETFFTGNSKSLTPEQRAVRHQAIEAARIRADEELRTEQENAALKAKAIYDAGSKDIASHTYASNKAVDLPLVRRGTWPQRGWHDALLVPLFNVDGKLRTLEAINADGDKDFLKGGEKKGCFYPFGKLRGAQRIVIGEGVATVAAVASSCDLPAVAAMDSGNLGIVAEMVRKLAAPDAEIIFAADNDPKPDGRNPGLSTATAAASLVGGFVALPEMGKACDFWDLWHEHGVEAVKQAIAGASAPPMQPPPPTNENPSAADSDGWPEPQPLSAKVEPEPYPLDALPDTIRAAVDEVAGFVKAPVPMVASSALAALSLAAQAHIDVRRDEILSGPVGLFLLTIAESGERKSQADKMFTKPIQDYQDEQAEAAKPVVKDHKAALYAWEAKRGGIKDKIRQLSKDCRPTASHESDLRDLERNEPKPPRVPKLIREDATPEGLAKKLQQEWPSAGVVSNEAGIVFGAHGMGPDSVMRNLALLNKLWDGGRYQSDRGDEERSRDVRGARLTMGLMIQESTLRTFFDQSKGLARGTGFLARFLVAWPESRMGTRFYTPPVAGSPALSKFNRRISELLNQPVPIDEDGILTPPMLMLAPEAKAAWVAFHDAIERELAGGGELCDVTDVASKSADNAVRLAALFQIFEHGMGGAIGLDCFESASRIAAWHLHEARRFFGELALPAELADAARLDSWLIGHCKANRTHLVGKNHVRQHGPLRNGKRLDAAIRELAELDRLQLVKDGKRLTIHLNPALMGVAP